MDDFIYSVSSPEEAHQLYGQLVNMYALRCYKLTIWVSNSSSFLEIIPEDSSFNKKLDFNSSDSETKLIDSSEKWYGAVIFIRIGPLSLPAKKVLLFCSRYRIAPLKKITLARLELCDTHLLSQHVRSVNAYFELRCHINHTFAFTDSTIALA
ncbi:unnamed protein product [Parnassius mnemosyne]|uniref:Maturase K n=1 Tax=Parnassius mnemosyne TaxID=213953 RepID=A0AAV1KB56_9NEOP